MLAPGLEKRLNGDVVRDFMRERQGDKRWTEAEQGHKGQNVSSKNLLHSVCGLCILRVLVVLGVARVVVSLVSLPRSGRCFCRVPIVYFADFAVSGRVGYL